MQHARCILVEWLRASPASSCRAASLRARSDEAPVADRPDELHAERRENTTRAMDCMLSTLYALCPKVPAVQAAGARLAEGHEVTDGLAGVSHPSALCTRG